MGPTGAVSHKGISIAPVDEFGNLGVSTSTIAFGSYQNESPPIAVDDTFDATEDTNLLVSSLGGVLTNDIDPDNTPGVSRLSAQLVSGPANGTLTLGSTGSVSYAPNADFHGTDTFVYRVYDGRFYSDNATVTINVASVNDAPAALDDYYFSDYETPITINAAAGVLANDSDTDGDIVTVAVVDNPTNGSVSLGADGSFNYTPNTGFTGVDTFTYVATDTLLDSRIATVSIEVTLPATKFFVVDTAVEGTFEYDAQGNLVENYSLRSGNKGSQGVTASTDGSTVWVINGNKRVFVYDGDGGYLGKWVAEGPSRVDGIATDDTDIWILDRKLDTVFHYAGAAASRAGTLAATDSFLLHKNNKNGKGITSDGTHIWIVNDVGGKDKVYKYTVDGVYQGRWNIDPVNAKPTGITIDPTGASDAIWIVDNASDSVYQYNGGTTRIKGSAVSDAVFALAETNTNPQGIADPLPGGVASTPLSAATDLGGFSSRPAATRIGREAPRLLRETVLGSMNDEVLRSDRYQLSDIELPSDAIASSPASKQRASQRERVGSADDGSELGRVFGDFDAELLDANCSNSSSKAVLAERRTRGRRVLPPFEHCRVEITALDDCLPGLAARAGRFSIEKEAAKRERLVLRLGFLLLLFLQHERRGTL